MPKRPHQHQLEDESRTAFRTKLPPEWVFEPITYDYGIDGRVEIFDKNGLTTGLMFFVQLKATAKPKLNLALAVSLKLDTCKYYRSLSLPVLIVRYHAPTRKLYVRWFHTFDPYYSRKAKKNITFRLTLEDEWHDETATRLVSELEAFNQLRSPQIKLPIRFALTLPEAHIHGIPAAHIALEIRKAAAKFSKVITISETSLSDASGLIRVENDKLEIKLASGEGFVLHTSKAYSIDVAHPKLPYDILTGIAVALNQAGHSNIAAQMISGCAANSSIITHPEILAILVNCMLQAHRVTEALRLSKMLIESEESLFAAEMFMLPAALSESDSLSDSEHEDLQSLRQRRIEQAVQAENWRSAATAHYNLGNYFRATDNLRLAFHHYRKAAKYCSEYLEKPYFCRELAGILFESRHYRLAVHFYRRAINLGEAGPCHALYADALMFAGRYCESLETFDTYLASEPNAAPEWGLKAWVLNCICQALDEQKRQTDAAMKLVTHDDKLSPIEYKQRLEEALRHDVLCSLAWFNLGVLESQTGNQKDAFVPFLIAALLQKNDLEAWCNAIAIGFFTLKEYYSLVPSIIVAAYQINGQQLVEQLLRFVQSQPEEFPKAEFLSVVDTMIGQIPKEERPFDLRLLGEGADFVSIAKFFL